MSARAPRVLGIDLAASLANPSTIALLEARRFVAFHVAHADEEIADLVERFAPARVAIDAPLTPPTGLAGTYAYRAAEREVRRAGIPILAPSFIAALTFRGMALRARGLGAPLVETYPHGVFLRLGHAPRGKKQTPAEGARRRALLARHLEGLPEVFANDHEADAAACALAAALHLEGKCEAFGAPDEGLVWLPRAERAKGPAKM